MNRPITNDDFRVCKQRHIQIKLKLDIYDLQDNYVDTIVGGVVNGSASINADSDVRRTFSLTIIPDWKSRKFVDEQGYIWIDKLVHVSIGIIDERANEPYWWKFGKFIFTNTNTTYDATNNQLTINCSDLMSTLDGSKNGELGQLSILFPAYKEFRSNANDIYYCKKSPISGDTYKATISGYNIYSNSDFIVTGLSGIASGNPLLQINDLPPLPIVDKENRERIDASDIKSNRIYSFFIDTNTAVLALDTGYDIQEYRKFSSDTICEYRVADHAEDFSITPTISDPSDTSWGYYLIDNINDGGQFYHHDQYTQLTIYDNIYPSGHKYFAVEVYAYDVKEGGKTVRKFDLRRISYTWPNLNGQVFSKCWLKGLLQDYTNTTFTTDEINYYWQQVNDDPSGDVCCIAFFTNKEYDTKTSQYKWYLDGTGYVYENGIKWRDGGSPYNLTHNFTVHNYNYYNAYVPAIDYPQPTDCISLRINQTFQTVVGAPIQISLKPYAILELIDQYGNELSPSAIPSVDRTYIFYVKDAYNQGSSRIGRAYIIDDYPPAYELPEGTPINYYTIRNAILTAVGQLAHIHKEECQVDDVGEYKALPIYNPDWEQYRIDNPLWDNIPYDLEFAHGDTVLNILQKLRDLYPNYETYFDENGIFCCNMIPSGDEDLVVIPADYYDDTIISENTSMDLTSVRNICHAWGHSLDAKFYSENVTYNQTSGQDLSSYSQVLITTYDRGTGECQCIVRNGTNRNFYITMPMDIKPEWRYSHCVRYHFTYDIAGNLINTREEPYIVSTVSSGSNSSSGTGSSGSTTIPSGSGQIGGDMTPISGGGQISPYTPIVPSGGGTTYIGVRETYPLFNITWQQDGYTLPFANYTMTTPSFKINNSYIFSGAGTTVYPDSSTPISSYNLNSKAMTYKQNGFNLTYPFTDYYFTKVEETTARGNDYNCFSATISGYDAYMSGDIIALKLPIFSGESIKEPRLNINNLGYVDIYDENTYLPLEADRLKSQTTYCFKIKKKRVDGHDYVSAYLLGSWQVQGIAALVSTRINSNPKPEDYYTTSDGVQVVKYSEEYFKAIYACPEVRLIVAPDSPFTCQRIGEVMSVYIDETNLTSDSLASSRADWEVYNKARLIDSISVTTKLSPFADVNIKVMYKRNDLNTVGYYIVKDVSHDLTNGTTTWQLMSFYPLYGSLNLTHGELHTYPYTHAQLSAFSHQNI